MFGIGTYELLVILVVAVLVLGPEHLPRVLRTTTKILSDFRRISTEFQRAVNLESYLTEDKREGVAGQNAIPKKRKKKQPPLNAAETPKDGSAPELSPDDVPPPDAVSPSLRAVASPLEAAAQRAQPDACLPSPPCGPQGQTPSSGGREKFPSAASPLEDPDFQPPLQGHRP